MFEQQQQQKKIPSEQHFALIHSHLFENVCVAFENGN